MSRYHVGRKVRSKYITFYRDGCIVHKYIPQVQIDGKFIFCGDEKSPSKLMECSTRKEAWLAAKSIRDKAMKKTSQEGIGDE
ncbi:hypothetical protein [Paenibacillus alvei]|uniref:Uncharacterized protein n=1 Tax=Paenibacillus alvei TaxID=44250 RepID=A0A383RFQ2_PAEAL|nr:hypothetical protein [Paenibacillus alvei]SYX85915.1 protein of unknown function [Paenibacillus alvei]